ncbi:MAG: Spx/MgsR family RNA polymerase-binding regulatory protein [Rhodospirillales bacterium]
MITVYGLKNCDTCRSALKWLKAEGIEHAFHDLRQDGLTGHEVLRWLAAVGPVTLINRKGTTWRNLSDAEKFVSSDEELAPLVLEYPAILKRPIFETGDTVIVGFKDEQRAALKG